MAAVDAPASFASVEDVELRYGALADDQRDRCRALLSDAEAMIRARLREGWETDPRVLPNLRPVTCAVVIRALQAGDTARALGVPAVKQASMTAGSYQQSWTLSNPDQTLYLTRQECRALRIAGCVASFVTPSGGGCRVRDL